MSEQQEVADRGNSKLNRRSFLKGAGLATGAMLVAPTLRDFVMPDSEPRDVDKQAIGRYTIGVILPHSKVYPALGPDFVNGLTMGLRQFKDFGGEWAFDLITEEVGLQTRLIVQKSHELVNGGRADFVVGVLSPYAVRDIRSIFNDAQTALIVSSIGENVVTQKESNPFVFYNSLNYWQSNHSMGRWAAQNIGRKVFIAASFYDSGYDSVYGFRRGFEGLGGEVVGSYTTHMRPDSDELELSIKAIEDENPDFVYAFYSGNEARDFVRAYDRAQLGSRFPLLGSAFMVEDDILSVHEGRALGVKSGFTWSRDLQTSENRAFTSAYKDWTGKPPGPFAVLGYDSARLIIESLAAVEGDTSRTVQLLGALASAEFDSPRGRLKMSQSTHITSSPIYLREARQIGNEVIAELEPVSETEDLGMTMASDLRSGWANAYLSV